MNFIAAGVYAWQDFERERTCESLDRFIQSRNTARVSNCRRADNCMSFTCNIGGIGDEASIKVSFPVCKYTSRSYMVRVTLNLTTTKTDLFGDPETVLTSSLSSKSSGDTVLHITDKTFLDINVLKLIGVTLKVSN